MYLAQDFIRCKKKHPIDFDEKVSAPVSTCCYIVYCKRLTTA